MSHFPQEIITVVGRCAAPLPARSAVGAPGGGLPGWSPADRAIAIPSGGRRLGLPLYPAFSVLFCPYPPDPLPGGKGETIILFCRGLRPRHPGIRPFAARTVPAMQVPGGGVPSLPPAAPCLYLLSCPHPPDPLPGGKGEPKVISCKGLRPLHPRG